MKPRVFRVTETNKTWFPPGNLGRWAVNHSSCMAVFDSWAEAFSWAVCQNFTDWSERRKFLGALTT